MAAYQTFLRDCDCERGGILFKDNIPCCRWCRTPYTKGGMINYDDEHFTHSVKTGKGTANDVLNTEGKKKAMKSWIDFMPEGIDPREVTANDVLNTKQESYDGKLTVDKETADALSSLPQCKNDVLNTEEINWQRRPKNKWADDLLEKKAKTNIDFSQPLNTEREWEVVEVIEDEFFGRISNHLNHSLELRVKEGHAKIKSVKRLSDNEVFSVGDRTISGEISSFKIGPYGMQVHFKGGTYYYIDKISKLPTPSQPQNNKERTVVTIDGKYHVNYGNYEAVHFRAHKDFPPEKMEELRQAIEKILNHE